MVKLFDNVGVEIPGVQSVKLMRIKSNTYRARLRVLVGTNEPSTENGKPGMFKIETFKVRLSNNGFRKVILARKKIEEQALVDFIGWPEAEGKKKIFVSVGSRSRLQ
jgi:recombinational DNA repair protein RecR